MSLFKSNLCLSCLKKLKVYFFDHTADKFLTDRIEVAAKLMSNELIGSVTSLKWRRIFYGIPDNLL